MRVKLRPSTAQLNATITAERDRRTAALVRFRGRWFQADDRSADALARAVAAGEPSPWITADNAVVAMTAEDLRELLAAITARATALAVKARELKDAVNAGALPDPADDDLWT